VKSVSLNFLDTDLHRLTQILPKIFVETIIGNFGNAIEHENVRDSRGIFVRIGDGKRVLKYTLLRKKCAKNCAKIVLN